MKKLHADPEFKKFNSERARKLIPRMQEANAAKASERQRRRIAKLLELRKALKTPDQ
jgi:hypothetical protein